MKKFIEDIEALNIIGEPKIDEIKEILELVSKLGSSYSYEQNFKRAFTLFLTDLID